MVFTIPQTNTFFTSDDQMAIPFDTLAQMEEEGITNVSDLGQFEDDDFTALANNLRRPGGTIPDPNDAQRQIPNPGFMLGTKSLKRLKVAACAVRYYEAIGRTLTPRNMHYTNVLVVFYKHWIALKSKKDADDPEVPKITKQLTIVKWSESMIDFLHLIVGARMIPLSYVVRGDVDVPGEETAPSLNNLPYSQEHGSVEAELIARASHTDPAFREDNAKVYHYLQAATRSTTYNSSIKPMSRTKDGRKAYFALINQYAGRAKWQAELKRQEELIHTRVWKGNTNFSLEKFITLHRNAYVSMVRCAEHIPYQLPNPRNRVVHLLDKIQCDNAPLQAAMANVRADEVVKMQSFEATAEYLLPYCPIAKKRASNDNKRPHASISGINAKHKRGKTGMEFRYHIVAGNSAAQKAISGTNTQHSVRAHATIPSTFFTGCDSYAKS